MFIMNFYNKIHLQNSEWDWIKTDAFIVHYMEMHIYDLISSLSLCKFFVVICNIINNEKRTLLYSTQYCSFRRHFSIKLELREHNEWKFCEQRLIHGIWMFFFVLLFHTQLETVFHRIWLNAIRFFVLFDQFVFSFISDKDFAWKKDLSKRA